MRCRLRAVLLSRLGDSGRAGRPAFEPSRRHVFEAGPPPSTLLCSLGPNLINPKAIAVPRCGRRHTGELEFARDPGPLTCFHQVCYFARVRVPSKTARWAVDFTGAHCGHVIQPWKLGFQPYRLTGGPSGPVPGWLPCFPGPLRRLGSVAAGPPAGGRATTCILRPWGRTLRFLLRFFRCFQCVGAAAPRRPLKPQSP